jgi:hypothetical protein
MKTIQSVITFIVACVVGVANPWDVWAAEGMDVTPPEVGLFGLGAYRADEGLRLEWTCAPDGFAVLFRIERWDAAQASYVDVAGPLPFTAAATDDPAVFRVVDRKADRNSGAIYRIDVHDKLGRVTRHGPFRVEPVDEAPPTAAKAAAVPETVLHGIGVPGYRIKIPIRETGVYRIDAATMADNLIGMTVDTATQFIAAAAFTLSSQGREVAWMSDPASTAILFYAVATNNRFTAENIYWLEVGTGTVMGARSGTIPAEPVASPLTYAASVRREVDTTAYPQFCMDLDADFWFWQLVWAGLAGFDVFTQTVVVDALGPFPEDDPAATSLSVVLRGASDILANPEHMAAVSLNGQSLATNAWNGFVEMRMEMNVTNLVEGTNTVRIQAYKTPGMGSSDYSYFLMDWFEVRYPRLYVARDDELSCAGHTNPVVTVAGFSTGNVAVLDVTDWANPLLVENVLATSTDGVHSVTFDSQSVSNRYFVWTADSVRTPSNVRGRVTADLLSTTNRARHLTIATPAFAAQAEDLAAHRRSQGLSALVVQVEDVLDVFGNGLFSPWPMREFLTHARNEWDAPPRYVVLAGSGSYDYKNRRGFGDCTVPPALALLNPYGLKVSDAPLADLAGGPAPELAIGRLHCQTTQELVGAIAKIKAYEQDRAWKSTVRFIADNLDPAAGDFSATCDAVASYVPTGYGVDRNYFDTQTLAQVRERVKSGINGGALLISYYGHGNPDQLADEKFLQKSDLTAFTNATGAPIMAGMTCDLAYFGIPGIERLGEGLVARPQGGLSGLWGAVAPTYNHVSERLGVILHQRMFDACDVRFGDAVVKTLTAYDAEPGRWLPILSLIAYLGDPATVIAPPAYSFVDWRDRTFSEDDLSDPEVSGPLADPDLDGRVNIVEFGWNSSPTNGFAFDEFDASIAYVETAPGETNAYGTIVFPRRRWREGYETRVEVSYDLIEGVWNHGSGVSWEESVVQLDDVMEEVTVRLKPPLSDIELLFVRLRTLLTD